MAINRVKTLTTYDLTQLETYLIVAKPYATKYRNCEACLVGNKQDDDLMKQQEFRSSLFRIWTYADLIDSTEERYK